MMAVMSDAERVLIACRASSNRQMSKKKCKGGASLPSLKGEDSDKETDDGRGCIADERTGEDWVSTIHYNSCLI